MSKVNASELKNLNSELFYAICGDSHGKVRKLLEEGADPNYMVEKNKTVIEFAYETNNIAIIINLLRAGAIPSEKIGLSPLHLAVINGKPEVIKRFMENKDRIQAGDLWHYTPLHFAAACGNTDIVNLLLENGADIEAKSLRNSTPLYIACFCGMASVANLLMERGADIHITNLGGYTPLFLVACFGYSELLSLLIKAGATPHVWDNEGHTPLWENVYNTPDDKESQLYKDRISITRQLIDAGADVNAVCKDDDEFPTLITAVLNRQHETVAILLNAGADPDVMDKYERTSLYLASHGCDLELVKILVENGGNIHFKGKAGESLLDAVLDYKKADKQILKYLLEIEEARTGKPYPRKELSLLMKKIGKVKTGIAGETADAVFARYKSFYKLLPKDIVDDTYDLKPALHKKDTTEIIASVEARLPIPIPEALKLFWANHGAFRIGDDHFQIYSAAGLLKLLTDKKADIKNNIGLYSMSGLRWGMPPEIEGRYKVLKRLDEQYICFGFCVTNPDVMVFYYFDKEGRFGEMIYDQDNFENLDTSCFTPLLKESKADKTFDGLISKAINNFIEEIIDNCEIS